MGSPQSQATIQSNFDVGRLLVRGHPFPQGTSRSSHGIWHCLDQLQWLPASPLKPTYYSQAGVQAMQGCDERRCHEYSDLMLDDNPPLLRELASLSPLLILDLLLPRTGKV